MGKQLTFEGRSDQPLPKKMSFQHKQHTLGFGENKNFVQVSAPPKMMGKEMPIDQVPMLDLKVTQT